MGTERDEVGTASSRWRRLSGRETALWYGLAGVTYVVASIWQKGLLNWIIGPLWLVAFVWLGPMVADLFRRREAP
jgi:hypothetical protein